MEKAPQRLKFVFFFNKPCHLACAFSAVGSVYGLLSGPEAWRRGVQSIQSQLFQLASSICRRPWSLSCLGGEKVQDIVVIVHQSIEICYIGVIVYDQIVAQGRNSGFRHVLRRMVKLRMCSTAF